MKKFILIIIGVLLIAVGIWFSKQGVPGSSEKELVCSGIAGIKCPAGYSCKITDKYPDAMGVCERI